MPRIPPHPPNSGTPFPRTKTSSATPGVPNSAEQFSHPAQVYWQSLSSNQTNSVVHDSDFPGTGFMVRNGVLSYAVRTLKGSPGQIVITNPAGAAGDPLFSIDPNYAGQSSITQLGIINQGDWQGDVIAPAFGGTGLAAVPSNGQLVIGNGTTQSFNLTNITGQNLTITNGPGTINMRVPGPTGYVVTPYDYGAVGNGSTDDTAAFQAMFDSGASDCYIPAGSYKTTSTINVTKKCSIRGAGSQSLILCSPASPQPGMRLSFDAPVNKIVISGFEIYSPNSIMSQALLVDVSTNSINTSLFEGLALYGGGGASNYGFYHNGGTNDGFAANTITNCGIINGLFSTGYWGDSNNLLNNTISGANNGITLTAITSGSANNIIANNNITSDGYSIYIGDYAYNTSILNNQIERVNAGQIAAIVLNGSSGKTINNVVIEGNNINGHAVATFALIYCNYANNVKIESNSFSSSVAAPAYYFENTCSNNQIGTHNSFNGLSFTDNATATSCVPIVTADGITTRTAANTFTSRTIIGTAGQITVTNGNGVSGNPTLSLPAAVTNQLRPNYYEYTYMGGL